MREEGDEKALFHAARDVSLDFRFSHSIETQRKRES